MEKALLPKDSRSVCKNNGFWGEICSGFIESVVEFVSLRCHNMDLTVAAKI